MMVIHYRKRATPQRRVGIFALAGLMALVGCSNESEPQHSSSLSSLESSVQSSVSQSSLSQSSLTQSSLTSQAGAASKASSIASKSNSTAVSSQSAVSLASTPTPQTLPAENSATHTIVATPSSSSSSSSASSTSSALAQSTSQPAAGKVADMTPSLNLDSLEQRLRDTKAIGVFTKLSLKNQVDDLLDDFRAFYGGKSKMVLTDLRQRYDLLVMKILTLLQDADTRLAADIRSSREAIWDILQDPEKFSKIS